MFLDNYMTALLLLKAQQAAGAALHSCRVCMHGSNQRLKQTRSPVWHRVSDTAAVAVCCQVINA